MSYSAAPNEATVPPPEDPAIVDANLRAGIRLFASAVAFLFIAFVFAFFYLKAVNANGNWRQPHIKPRQGFGIAILVCVLAATALVELARRGPVRALEARWVPHLGLALLLSLAAVVLTVINLTAPGFSALDGGYASVFFGFTAMFGVALLGAVYWIETLFVGVGRGAAAPAGHFEHQRASIDACAVWMYLLAATQVVSYILLYLIKVMSVLLLLADKPADTAAGAVLTLVIPLGLTLIAFVVWWLMWGRAPRE